MKPTTRYRLKVAKARIVRVVDLPFLLIELPHIWLVRHIRSLVKDAMRLEFVRQGMCGGCSKFGTRRCKKHVRNPYAILDRGCLDAD